MIKIATKKNQYSQNKPSIFRLHFLTTKTTSRARFSNEQFSSTCFHFSPRRVFINVNKRRPFWMFCAPSVVFYECAQYNRSRRRTTNSLTNTHASVCARFNDYLDQSFFEREKSRILSVKRYSLIVIVIARSRYPISALGTKCSRLHHLFFAHAHTLTYRSSVRAQRSADIFEWGATTTTKARTHVHIEILEVKEWKLGPGQHPGQNSETVCVVVCVSDVIDFVELAPSNSTSRMGLKINHKAYCDPSPSWKHSCPTDDFDKFS